MLPPSLSPKSLSDVERIIEPEESPTFVCTNMSPERLDPLPDRVSTPPPIVELPDCTNRLPALSVAFPTCTPILPAFKRLLFAWKLTSCIAVNPTTPDSALLPEIIDASPLDEPEADDITRYAL